VKAHVDPPRLVESPDADPSLRDALRIIRDDAPNAVALGAMADGAERAVRAAGPGPAAAAATPALAAKLAVVVMAVSGGALLYAGVRSTPRGTPAPPPRASVTVQDERDGSERKRVELAEERPGTKAVSLAEPPKAATAPPTPRDAPDHARGPTATPAVPAPDAHELGLLETAQRAVGPEPRRALALLNEHRNTYPRSRFSQERDVLALEAFRQLRDRKALQDGARAFFARYPRSPHRARVNRLLDAPP
jgi:hypothetical protein